MSPTRGLRKWPSHDLRDTTHFNSTYSDTGPDLKSQGRTLDLKPGRDKRILTDVRPIPQSRPKCLGPATDPWYSLISQWIPE